MVAAFALFFCSAVFDYVRDVVQKQLPSCQVYSVGSFPLKTYLPCADVDMVMFLPRNTGSNTKYDRDELIADERDAPGADQSRVSDVDTTPALVAVNQALCMVATKRGGKKGGDHLAPFMPGSEHKARPEIRNVSFINARTPMVTMLVGNVVVDLTENQAGSVAASVLVEEADRFIQRNHLFKRSLLLLKAWALCETPRLVGQRVLGAREGGLTSYGLSVMVLHLFSSRRSADTLAHPLDVFIRFFQVFADFDWSRHCLTLDGSVAFHDVRDYRHGGSKTKGNPSSRLWPLVDKVLWHLTPAAEKAGKIRGRRTSKSGRRLDGYEGSSRVSGTAGAADSSAAHFPIRHCNIQDPLNGLNNLGHSVSRRTLKALEYALQLGRQQLEECQLLSPVISKSTTSRGNDARRRTREPERAGAGRAWEGRAAANGPAPGGAERAAGGGGRGLGAARLNPPQPAAPLPVPINAPAAYPRQLFAPVPLLRYPPMQSVQPGVLLGSAQRAHVPQVHHLVGTGGQQFWLGPPHSQSLMQLPAPMYKFVYHPYMVPEGRASTGATIVLGGHGQARPHAAMLVPAIALQGHRELPSHRHMPRSAPAGLQCEQQNGARDIPAGCGHSKFPARTHVQIDRTGREEVRPNSFPWFEVEPNRPLSSPSGTLSHDEGKELGATEKESYKTGRSHIEEEKGRHPAFQPPMLPWNLPAFTTSSPTSSTASMSESAEDGSKDDHERQLLYESGADDDLQRPQGKAHQRALSESTKCEPSVSAIDGSEAVDLPLGRRQQAGRGGGQGASGKRAKRALGSGGSDGVSTNASLWANWFLRDFFPSCCQLYGSGDGFREDLLDHPCQHWSSLQRNYVTSLRPTSRDNLSGASGHMWSALENVGKIIQGASPQPFEENIGGEQPRSDRTAVMENEAGRQGVEGKYTTATATAGSGGGHVESQRTQTGAATSGVNAGDRAAGVGTTTRAPCAAVGEIRDGDGQQTRKLKVKGSAIEVREFSKYCAGWFSRALAEVGSFSACRCERSLYSA